MAKKIEALSKGLIVLATLGQADVQLTRAMIQQRIDKQHGKDCFTGNALWRHLKSLELDGYVRDDKGWWSITAKTKRLSGSF